jgi:hypothetical protein
MKRQSTLQRLTDKVLASLTEAELAVVKQRFETRLCPYPAFDSYSKTCPGSDQCRRWLDERQCCVVAFAEENGGMTLDELGKFWDRSRERLRQIEDRALGKVLKRMDPEAFTGMVSKARLRAALERLKPRKMGESG